MSKNSAAIALFASVALSSNLALAGEAAVDHSAHHAASSSAASSPAQAVQPPTSSQAADDQMKAMHAMHEKMMAAKTPQERQALMKEHMKLMNAGMSMMEKMSGDSKDMPMRMDMMTMMMQMMMDGDSMMSGPSPKDDAKK